MSNEHGSAVRVKRGGFRQSCRSIAFAVVGVGILFLLMHSLSKSPGAELAAQGRADQTGMEADAGVQDPPWGESLNGVQFRLQTKHNTWQSWQQPIVVLEIRNVTPQAIPAAQLQQRLPPDRRTGLTLMRRPAPTLSEAELYRLEVRWRPGAEVVRELKSGDTFRLPLVILSTSLTATN